MTKEQLFVTSGAETALLVGAMTASIAYPFRRKEDADFQKRLGREIGVAGSKIEEQWAAKLQRCGLDTRFHWASMDRKDRAALTVTLTLTPDVHSIAEFAVRACIHEFDGRWQEFLAIAAGGLHKYGVAYSDLMSLAKRLTQAKGSE